MILESEDGIAVNLEAGGYLGDGSKRAGDRVPRSDLRAL